MESGNRIVVVGSLNMDLVVQVPRLPREGETLSGGDLHLFEGGKGANQAVAAGRLSGRVAMVGQVGDDAFGSKLLESLAASGVDTTGVSRCGRSTGTACISVLSSGQNSIIISPGANATLTPDEALSRLGELKKGDLVLFQLETPLETVAACLAEARRVGATTMLDPAPIQPLPPEMLRNIDILTPNQTETAGLLGDARREPRDFAEAREAAAALLERGPGTVVIKLGSAGCYVASNGSHAPVEGFLVEAVDSTAAGDTFNGALAVALAEGKYLPEAARFANAAAAVSVTRLGAQNSIPWRKEVEEFLSARAQSAKC